jgi:hypothetical protein
MANIYFGGSRKLLYSSIINQVVHAVLRHGHTVHVGDCIGADALIITSALVAGGQSPLVVFAVSNENGTGSLSLSSSLPKVAAERGALVHWLAGGSLTVPPAGRLINRSLAAAAGCAAAVFFSPGRGSLAVASSLFSKMPVYAFAERPPNAPRGCVGHWKFDFLCIGSSAFQCWSWKSAQASFI